MPKTIASPNDSLIQSTREPSTGYGDRTSLDASSQSVARRQFLTGNAQMGGGSYKSYLMEHLSRMHLDIESTTRKLELEQRRLYTLDKLIDGTEVELETKRGTGRAKAKKKEEQDGEEESGGRKATDFDKKESEKREEGWKARQAAVDSAVEHKAESVKVLERNLVKAIENLNKGNCETEQLREQIDQLRKERTILDSVFKTMEKDINSNKKLLEKEKMNLNENKFACEEAKQKSRALNKMLERERRAFKDETKQLHKDLYNESEVQKEQDNLHRFSRMADNPAGSKGKNRRAYMVADEEEAFSEPQMHRRILKLSFLNTIQRRHIKQHQKNIEVFEQAFATIKSSTGISDIEEIVKIFIGLEQRNFSLLTYVNELNRDIESIEIRNRELQNQAKTYKDDQNQSAKRKAEALKELTEQIKKTKAATEEKENMIGDAAAALVLCRPKLEQIVSYLKANFDDLITRGYEGDPPPMKFSAPDDHEENLNSYLMYIEDAILQFRPALPQDAQHLASSRPQPPRIPPQRSQKPNELPSAHITGEDSDDDPDTGLGDRPWTRTELRDRAQAMIQRRKRKQHGKLMGEDKRAEAADDMPVAETSRGGPPPARGEYAASSTASKDADSGGSSLAKTPSASIGKPAPDGSADLGNEGDRPENWWRGQGKEKGRS